MGIPLEHCSRRHRVRLVRRFLGVVTDLCHVLCTGGTGRAARDRRRLVPDPPRPFSPPSCRCASRVSLHRD